MTKRASRLVAQHVDGPVAVAEIWVLKVGALGFRVPGDPPSHEDDFDKLGTSMIDEFVGRLRGSANIFDLPPVDTEKLRWGFRPLDEAFLLHGVPLSFAVKLPNHKHAFQGGEPIEEFFVTTDGSAFGAFSPIPDAPSLVFVAHEYREAVKRAASKEPKCDIQGIGPTPLHPDFYFIVLEKPVIKKPPLAFFHRGDAYFVSNTPSTDMPSLIEAFYRRCQHYVSDFYAAGLQRDHVTSLRSDILDQFDRIAELASTFFKTPDYRLIRRGHIAAEVSELISENLVAIGESQIAAFNLADMVATARKSRIEFDLLEPLADYEREHLVPAAVLPDALLPAMTHFRETMHAYRTAAVAMLGAVVGAVLGAALVTFFG
jgi:hypothetical protein